MHSGGEATMTDDPPATATPRRPTINDVAVASGVTKGTVSRYLNGKNWISPATRDAVQAAIDQLGYVPNGLARNLARERTNCVAVIFSDPTRMLSQNSIFAALLEAVTRKLAGRGVAAVLMFADSPQLQAEVIAYVRARHVDGVILLSASAGDSLASDLLATGIPLTAGGPLGRAELLPIPYVGLDDAMGSQQAVTHLLEIGRRRIGIVSGPRINVGTETRFRAASNALSQIGVPVASEEAEEYSSEAGYAATRCLFETAKNLDALYVASDVLAKGALQYLHDSGRRVPDDVAVVGFDDAPDAATFNPPLTTVAGIAGDQTPATLMLDILDGKPPRSILIPTALVKRASA